MKTFTDYIFKNSNVEYNLNEAKIFNGITGDNVTKEDIINREIYSVFDKTTKQIITSDDGKSKAVELSKKSAQKIAQSGENLDFGSKSYLLDNGIR